MAAGRQDGGGRWWDREVTGDETTAEWVGDSKIGR